MSDQANTAPTGGGEQNLNIASVLDDAVSFAPTNSMDPNDWGNEDDGQQQDQGQQDQGDQQPIDQQAEPKDADKPQAGAMSQEQLLQLFAAQAQYNQQALPQMVAAAVSQAMAAMGFKPPAEPAPADPYAGIDADSPDADWQRMHINNRLLQERLDKLEGKWQQNEQTWQQQQQQAQQTQQHAQFTGWVNENVSLGADFFFAGWPESPQTAALKQMAATQIDAEWARNGYTQEAFTKAISAVRPHMESLAKFKPAAQAGGQNRAPGTGQRPGQAGGQPTTQQRQEETYTSLRDFFDRGPMSHSAIMSRMRGGNN
jgi:hypothetical protein